MILISANLVGPSYPMLHTKSQGHWPSGSVEEDFLRVFNIYWRGGHLGHGTRSIYINFGYHVFIDPENVFDPPSLFTALF